MQLSLSDSLNEFKMMSTGFNQFEEFKEIDFDKEYIADYKKLYNSFQDIAKFINSLEHGSFNKHNKINIASLKHYLINFERKLFINLCNSFLRPIDSQFECNFDDIMYLFNYIH